MLCVIVDKAGLNDQLKPVDAASFTVMEMRVNYYPKL